MPLKLSDDKSTLVQVMAWCRQATSHYLSQLWPRSLSPNGITRPQWVNIKTIFPRYEDSHVKDKMVMRLSCLVHPGVRDKRRVSEIDLSQPRHETTFWWRHNGPVTSQSTDPIKWPNYPLQLIGIHVHINTQNKESLTQRCRRTTNVQLWLIRFCTYLYGLSLNGWHALFCIINNHHDVTIATHAIKRHFLIWITMVR